jgi:uncharacterized protein (DUF433 family)
VTSSPLTMKYVQGTHSASSRIVCTPIPELRRTSSAVPRAGPERRSIVPLLAGIFFRAGRRIPPKRSGQTCIRDLRLTVKDILEYLAGGMSENGILSEFPDLEKEDFAAVYAYAASELAGSHQ